LRTITFCELSKERGYPCDSELEKIIGDEMFTVGSHSPKPIKYEFPQEKN
jgi:hypothetical protein